MLQELLRLVEDHVDDIGHGVNVYLNDKLLTTTTEEQFFYRVMDTNRCAKYPDCEVHPSWDKCDYDTFEKAEKYALNWLGCFSPGPNVLKLGEPFTYGSEAFIIILKIKK